MLMTFDLLITAIISGVLTVTATHAPIVVGHCNQVICCWPLVGRYHPFLHHQSSATLQVWKDTDNMHGGCQVPRKFKELLLVGTMQKSPVVRKCTGY